MTQDPDQFISRIYKSGISIIVYETESLHVTTQTTLASEEPSGIPTVTFSAFDIPRWSPPVNTKVKDYLR